MSSLVYRRGTEVRIRYVRMHPPCLCSLFAPRAASAHLGQLEMHYFCLFLASVFFLFLIAWYLFLPLRRLGNDTMFEVINFALRLFCNLFLCTIRVWLFSSSSLPFKFFCLRSFLCKCPLGRSVRMRCWSFFPVCCNFAAHQW